ncbi:plant basic secretory protein (BSP) family protein [Actinidia rufa]|uniref:Plant basic secretory protein (BSP) family protein n=1 Tax=Actinidia rufa TaxID=165716 RepID=A0A7J0DUU5_9ERIC|nr:plant basic secretory protein (BSP) family protein [Actinidia rufa]
MANMIILFLSFTVINLATLQGSQAVEYTVTNNAETTPGGIRFTNEIGLEYSKQTLISATEFIWRLFQQNTVEDRRNTPKLSLSIEPNMDGVAVSSNDHIRVSANYINGFQGDVRREITGVLYHETAGYVANYWAKPGEGNKWDEGYSVTAWFLDYCHGLRNGFVAELNKKMRNGYSDNFFFELLGKTVDQLWSDYKAKYNTN